MINASMFVRPPREAIRLEDLETGATPGLKDEKQARQVEEEATRRMVRAQDLLQAHERHGVLVIFQGMDASGKDEAIRDVLSSLDPRSTEFKQFKKMTEKEARHDYLWRVFAALPGRGQIGIFNRSYYEHVTGDRVHPERLDDQYLPDEARENIWKLRLRQISDFERYLTENGIHVLKFFLHVSSEVQRQRLLERVEDPETSWDFSESDLEDRRRWDEFQQVYGKALTATNTEHAPWFLLPADHRWYARAVVASLLAEKLESLHSGYPEPTPEQQEVLQRARRELREGTA